MTRYEQYKLQLNDCKKLFSLKGQSFLESLYLIFGVKDAYANLSCIIVIIILFRGPSTNRWRCERTDYWQLKRRIRCRWLKRLFLDYCLDDGIGGFVPLWHRSRVVANRTYRTFEAEIIWGLSVSFRFRRGRRGGWRDDWWRSNWWGIRGVQCSGRLTWSISPHLRYFRLAWGQGFWDVAVCGRESRSSIRLSRSVSDLDFPTIFVLHIFCVLSDLFRSCLIVGERASLGILPKVSVALRTSPEFGIVIFPDSNFRDSGFLDYSICGRSSHNSPTWGQRLPESSEVPLWPFWNFSG